MGTKFTIALYATDAKTANRAIADGFARIAELDNRLSDYDGQSELSRLSKSAPCLDGIKVSKDLLRVLQLAQQVSRASDGAFDVTVGPLTRLWRRARRQHRLPPDDRLAEARQAVGHELMQVDDRTQRVRLLRPGMRLDLGGIAKGYAVDAALRAITQRGITSAMVNASGDLAVSGAPPGRRGWLIGIASLEPAAEPSRLGWLQHQAIATSGDAFQFVEIDGQRYSHIVDPRTGRGLTQRSSVSVLASNCTTADAWASAASVLGPAAGLKCIEQLPRIEALFVFRPAGATVVRTCETADFARSFPRRRSGEKSAGEKSAGEKSAGENGR